MLRKTIPVTRILTRKCRHVVGITVLLEIEENLKIIYYYIPKYYFAHYNPLYYS